MALVGTRSTVSDDRLEVIGMTAQLDESGECDTRARFSTFVGLRIEYKSKEGEMKDGG